MVASRAPPTGNLACNPSMCPDWESNQPPFGWEAGAQSTEPHQLGFTVIFYSVLISPAFSLSLLIFSSTTEPLLSPPSLGEAGINLQNALLYPCPCLSAPFSRLSSPPGVRRTLYLNPSFPPEARQRKHFPAPHHCASLGITTSGNMP